jgi:hypothetical protein
MAGSAKGRGPRMARYVFGIAVIAITINVVASLLNS